MPSMTEDLGRLAVGIAASRRGRMAASVERRREVGSRHRAVVDQLREIRTMRATMSRKQHKDAATGRRERRSGVEGLLRQFHRTRDKIAAEARVQAASFMRDLTGRVAALRDAFSASQEARAKSRHDLAEALQQRLAGYRQDRHDSGAAWHGTPARHARPPAPAGEHRPAAERNTARTEASQPGRYRAPQATSGKTSGSP
jgi:hypothetical protein